MNMFRWFGIEERPLEWDNQLKSGYNYIFNNFAYLKLNKYGKSRIVGVINDDCKLRIGGLIYDGDSIFECFTFQTDLAKQECLNELLEWLSLNSINKVVINSFGQGVEDYEVTNNNLTLIQRCEFIADYKYYSELSKKRLHSTHRRTVNKFEKGLFTFFKIKKNIFFTLVNLYLAKVERKRFLFEGIKAFLKEIIYFYKLSTLVKKHSAYTLYGLKDNRRLLSYALILSSGDKAYYMIGASSRRGYQNRSSVYLMWKLINKYSDSAIEFNLGGANAIKKDGVYQFKKQFGLKEQNRVSIKVIL